MTDDKTPAVHIYPGGRRVLKSVRSSWLVTRENAVDWLAGGSDVYIKPEDVEYVLGNIVLDKGDGDGR